MTVGVIYVWECGKYTSNLPIRNWLVTPLLYAIAHTYDSA